jgi:hypothetical protein
MTQSNWSHKCLWSAEFGRITSGLATIQPEPAECGNQRAKTYPEVFAKFGDQTGLAL